MQKIHSKLLWSERQTSSNLGNYVRFQVIQMKFTVPHTVVMVRPATFGFNIQTAASNTFQTSDHFDNNELKHTRALAEFDRMHALLSSSDVNVRVFEDSIDVEKPDAIFPNNWISFHPDGKVVLYPMMAPNRRAERRVDIIETLRGDFQVKEIIDLTPEEKDGRFLEGTGSVVFDHTSRVLFACRSPRTSEYLVRQLADILEYKPVIFDATNERNIAIYHTNVMMAIGKVFAVICLDAIGADDDQDRILDALFASEKKIVAISYAQMNSFAGNLIEVETTTGEPLILLSRSAIHTLLPGQINTIAEYGQLLPIDIPTIERYGGGSVRCMVAGVHLPKRNSV
jgi:hypothetical protein